MTALVKIPLNAPALSRAVVPLVSFNRQKAMGWSAWTAVEYGLAETVEAPHARIRAAAVWPKARLNALVGFVMGCSGFFLRLLMGESGFSMVRRLPATVPGS